MAEYLVEYTDKADRLAKVAEQQALGRQMLHDDFTETGGVMTFIDPLPPTDEQLHQEALAQEFNDKLHAGLTAYNNWDSLTPAQKNTVLKNLLGFILYREQML